MHGAQWMDVDKHPEITFEALKAAKVQREGDTMTAQITGKLTVHGVTKEVTVPVKFTYLKDKLSARVPNLKGDLLVVRTKFTILRSDYGINPGAPAEKVSNEIELSLSLAGAAPAKQNT
jgi:polyisoprenoid-binding protein YceI